MIVVLQLQEEARHPSCPLTPDLKWSVVLLEAEVDGRGDRWSVWPTPSGGGNDELWLGQARGRFMPCHSASAIAMLCKLGQITLPSAEQAPHLVPRYIESEPQSSYDTITDLGVSKTSAFGRLIEQGD